MKLSIATRQSALAIWQAEHVGTLLQHVVPDLVIELVRTTTVGDRNQRDSIAALGGKGVFATDVQKAVLDGRADIAVHSAKDLPSIPTPGLIIAAVPTRGEPRDALIGARLLDLPEGAIIGTGSLRRRSALAALRSDLQFVELRGNIETRLRKAKEQNLDGVVLAACALERLEMADEIGEYLDIELCVPQVGQGALAVEIAEDRTDLFELLQKIEDPLSRYCVDIERAYLAALGGDCRMPTGAHAFILNQDSPDEEHKVVFAAMLASSVGGRVLTDSFMMDVNANGDRSAAAAQAEQVALSLKDALN